MLGTQAIHPMVHTVHTVHIHLTVRDTDPKLPDLTLLFDKKCNDLSAIKTAAYKLSDICSIEFSSDEKNYCCRVFMRGKKPSTVSKEFEHTFRSMVLDEELREKISRDTEPMRNLILSYAFSQTGLTEDG